MNLDYNEVAFFTYILAVIVLKKMFVVEDVVDKVLLFIVGGKIKWNSCLKGSV